MSRYFYILTALAVMLNITPPALAAQIPVRSGEHKEYSRLVFELGPRFLWSLSNDGSVYYLDLSPGLLTVDLSNVFKRIPHTRLLSVKQIRNNPARIVLSLAKDQMAKGFLTGPGNLVIDIAKGTPPAPATKPSQASNKEISATKPAIQTVVLQPPAHPAIRQDTSSRAIAARIDLPVKTPRSRPPAPLLPDMDILKARRALVAQLGRAMTEGILDPSLSAKIPLPSETTAVVSQSANRKARSGSTNRARSLQKVPPDASFADQMNINTQSVFDRASPPSEATVGKESRAARCLDPSLFDLQDWRGDGDVTERISKLRSKMLEEFDRVNEKALLDLVKLYIEEGFGTEASALIQDYRANIAHPDLLEALATLIEKGPSADSDILASQVACPGGGNLWGSIAKGGTRGFLANAAALPEEIAKLPIDLRQRVGAMLLSRLIDAELIPQAREVRDIIMRGTSTPIPALAFQNARLDQVTDRPERAMKTLGALAGKDSPWSDYATLELLRIYSEKGRVAPADLVANAEFRAFRLRSTPLGKRLFSNVVLSLAKMQQQATAFQMLVAETDAIAWNDQNKNALVAAIFSSFDPNASKPDEFVRIFFKYRHLLSADKSMDDARRNVISGLLQAGLPNVALKTSLGFGPRMPSKNKVLRAKIFLALDRPQDALNELQGLQSNRARALQIEALARNGQREKAVTLARETPGGTPPDLAWRASRWDVVSRSKLASRREVAKRFAQTKQSGNARPAAPEDTLGHYSDILSQSKKIRSSVDQLLVEHPDP